MGAPHLELGARFVAALALAALGLAGCGGGSGGAGPGPSEYHVIALRRDIAGDSVESYTVRYVALESGALRGGSGFASATGGPAAQPDLPFAVDAARSLTASPPWGPPATGRMSEDGVLGAATAVAAGLAPHFMLVVQRHPSPTLADLVGEWFVAGYARRPGATGGSSTTCFLSESQISPTGSLTTTGLEHINSDGVVTSGIPSLTALSPVSVEADGWVRIDVLGSGYRGGLSVDGNVLLLGSSGSGLVGIPGFAEVLVLVRRGLAVDGTQTHGMHAVGGFLQSGAAFASLAGTGTFVGSSGGPTSLLGSVDGALTPPFAPDLGIFTFVSGKCHVRLGAVELRGAAGPAGRYVLTTGGYTSGDETGLFTFVR